MRLLHTSDWHLGRQLHGRSLLPDQAHMLDQIVGMAHDCRPDAILIAGDVFDRAVPPPEAVALLDDALARLVHGLAIPVVMIAGNHDSGERLGFGARLLEPAGLHIAGPAAQPVRGVPLVTRQESAWIYPLPYAEPGAVRSQFEHPESLGHAGAMRLALAPVLAAHPADSLAVLVAHAFVTGGTESTSERPLSVGGSGAIGGEIFAGFDYVALGHLHRPQTLSGGRMRYAGSPLHYSVSEIGGAKSVSLVELARGQLPQITALPITPLHALHLLTGSLAEVCAAADGIDRDDYVVARLTDRGALLDPMARLRVTYPNALGIERLILQETGAAGARGARRASTTPEGLFASFFAEVTGETLLPDQQDMLMAVLAELLAQGQLASSGQGEA